MIAYGQLQGVQIGVGGGRTPGPCTSKLPKWLACQGTCRGIQQSALEDWGGGSPTSPLCGWVWGLDWVGKSFLSWLCLVEQKVQGPLRQGAGGGHRADLSQAWEIALTVDVFLRATQVTNVASPVP